jgi:hypothetical protein
MRKFLLVLLGLVVVLIGAALIVPFLVPTDTYKQQIAREVERATGRREINHAEDESDSRGASLRKSLSHGRTPTPRRQT